MLAFVIARDEKGRRITSGVARGPLRTIEPDYVPPYGRERKGWAGAGTPSCGFEPQTTRLTVGGSTGLSYDGPRGHTSGLLK